MKHIFLLVLKCSITFHLAAQADTAVELSRLKDCEIYIKLNQSTMTPDFNFIESLKGVEVVWFIVGTRNTVNVRRPQRIASFQTKNKDGKKVVFLMPKDRVTKSGGKISGVYPNWNLIDGLKFYRADCFYEKIRHL